MRSLSLIGDDLTGVLDSACAFAAPSYPVVVPLPDKAYPKAPRLAVNTQTREKSEAQATRLTQDIFHQHEKKYLGRDVLWFKKIDSVMRGHPFDETAEIFKTGSFEQAIFAPSFAQMGRITIGAQQYVVANGQYSQVGADFIEAFAAHGLSAHLVNFDTNCPTLPTPIALIDADNAALLQQRVATILPHLSGKTLWIGTGGLADALARALGNEHASVAFPPVAGMIIGTNHPVALAQTRTALDRGAILLEDGALPQNLISQYPWIFAPSLQAQGADAVEISICRYLPDFILTQPERTSLIVTGGETLSLVLKAVDADYLDCLGEAATGVPVSRVSGGNWHGVTLLSKSGGFGAANLFTRLAAL